ncbi:hypothetical protein [Nostoc sp.]|uniref:hypothetical protein n=1 Tax=Nostoc sp. TaxID=1180 RepID=UPI0035938551
MNGTRIIANTDSSSGGSLTASGIARTHEELDPIETGLVAKFQLVELLQRQFF